MHLNNNAHLDSLLNFSKLHYLIFSAKWQLLGLYPKKHNFLGWSDEDRTSFSFENDFLRPNDLDLQKFLGKFQYREHMVQKYFWRTLDKKIVGPFETYLRLTKESGIIKTMMVFVKINPNSTFIRIDPEAKFKLYLSDLLPGLVHNINGPLGIITGRTELLQKEYPELNDLEEILLMGKKINSTVENITSKLLNEKNGKLAKRDFNRFFKEEINLLESDIILKHQVKKEIELDESISPFYFQYFSVSGILNEFFNFSKKFLVKNENYIMQSGTFSEENKVGFYISFLGAFKIPEELNVRFPIEYEGNGIQYAQTTINGLDTTYLSFCLKHNNGYLKVIARKDILNLRFLLPVVHQVVNSD